MNSNDCLKYIKVIYKYFRGKHNLTQSQLEVLLFLKSESYFRKSLLIEYSQLTGWYYCTDFKILFDRGYIQLFRNTGGPRNNIYELSFKAKRMLTEFYSVINGEELIVKGRHRFTKNKPIHADKEYLKMIKRMNESIRQQQHQTLES